MFNKLQKRIEQKAENAFMSALDKTANAVNMAIDTGARIKALTDNPDESMSVESMVLVFVDTVRDENNGGRPTNRAEILAAHQGRQRLVKWISRLGPWGAAAGYLSTLYSEAAILCDAADAAQLGLSRAELGAQVLVLWGVMPDADRALAAMQGEEGQSVADCLKSRLPTGDKADNPDRMTMRQIVGLLWKVRSMRKPKGRVGKNAVEDMLASAEEQLYPYATRSDVALRHPADGAARPAGDDPGDADSPVVSDAALNRER